MLFLLTEGVAQVFQVEQGHHFNPAVSGPVVLPAAEFSRFEGILERLSEGSEAGLKTLI